MTTRQTTMRGVDVSIILPGTWATIAVDDVAASERTIAALVKRQVGRDDRLAGVRRQTRDQLRDVVARARGLGVFQVALSLEILPGVPFPAALFLDFSPWDGARPERAEHTTRLRAMLPSGEILDLEPGLTMRTWRQVEITPGSELTSDTKLEYLLPTPDGEQLLHIVADAPVECEPEMIVALFDSMVDSIRWLDPLGAIDGIR